VVTLHERLFDQLRSMPPGSVCTVRCRGPHAVVRLSATEWNLGGGPVRLLQAIDLLARPWDDSEPCRFPRDTGGGQFVQ
jgi:hypothetical protein